MQFADSNWVLALGFLELGLATQFNHEAENVWLLSSCTCVERVFIRYFGLRMLISVCYRIFSHMVSYAIRYCLGRIQNAQAR